MQKSAKSKAEEQFAATQKKDRTVLKAKEKAKKDRADHTAHLRAQRLAKEAADRESAKK